MPKSLENIDSLKTIAEKVFNIPRSITGKGVVNTLDVFKEYVNFEYKFIESGTKFEDWIVPDDWSVEKIQFIHSNKNLIDYKNNNLHSVIHSKSFNVKGKLSTLNDYFYYHSNLKNAVPYVTSYYKDNVGICITKDMYQKYKNEKVNISVESKFKKGGLNIAEILIPGKTDKEVVLNTYLCHPAMGNNELSGPLVMLLLYEKLKSIDNYFSYRFNIFPESIGAIAYLNNNYEHLVNNLHFGLVLTCLGGPSKNVSYKMSKDYEYKNPFNEFIKNQSNIKVREFKPSEGSNERHFNFPNVRLPFGQFSRTIYGKYKEYHTSLDDLDFINYKNLIDSSETIYKLLKNLNPSPEKLKFEETKKKDMYLKLSDQYYMPLNKFGEPFLSRKTFTMI